MFQDLLKSHTIMADCIFEKSLLWASLFSYAGEVGEMTVSDIDENNTCHLGSATESQMLRQAPPMSVSGD